MYYFVLNVSMTRLENHSILVMWSETSSAEAAE